jgi:hypothetical protein
LIHAFANSLNSAAAFGPKDLALFLLVLNQNSIELRDWSECYFDKDFSLFAFGEIGIRVELNSALLERYLMELGFAKLTLHFLFKLI